MKTLEREVTVDGATRTFTVDVPESLGEAIEKFGSEAVVLDLAVSKYLGNTNNVVKGCNEGDDYQKAVGDYVPGSRRSDGLSISAAQKQLSAIKKTDPDQFAYIMAQINDMVPEETAPAAE